MPNTALAEALQRLDTGDFEVTDFEASVLETCLRQRTWASAKQRRILAQMCERYMQDALLAGELCGQLRLLEDV